MAVPPDPAIGGGPAGPVAPAARRDAPILETWLSHQTNDAYLEARLGIRRLCADQCPVYIVDGWVDTYVNTVASILAHVNAPRKALFGPWAHNSRRRAPARFEWAYEEVRWWAQWLAGGPHGNHAGAHAAGLHDVQARTRRRIPMDTPGRWVAEDVWPSPRKIGSRTWYFDGTAGRRPQERNTASVSTSVTDRRIDKSRNGYVSA